MPGFKLLYFADGLELSRAVAKAWLDLVESTSRLGRAQYVALSGGRIARHFFSAVVEISRTRVVSLANVHFFWADERCVPPEDEESNFALAEEFLLRPLAIVSSHIHRIRGEDNSEVAAGAAAAEMRRLVPVIQGGQPVLDVIFLGLGEDGHVASLFPGSQFSPLGNNVYHSVTAPKPPPRRITINYETIAAAQEVWVLASGRGKEEALQSSLTSGTKTPLAKVLNLKPTTEIFTDIKLPKREAGEKHASYDFTTG